MGRNRDRQHETLSHQHSTKQESIRTKGTALIVWANVANRAKSRFPHSPFTNALERLVL